MVSAMLNSEQLSPRILESMSSVILVFNCKLQLTYINPAGETMFSLSARQLINKTYAELIVDKVDLESHLQMSLENQHPFTQHEIKLTLVSDIPVVVDFIVVPLIQPDGENALLVELYKLDRLLQISREENQMVQQQATQKVMRGLAHEIKNPLSGLRGAAQLLGRELDSDELKEYTQVIIDEADRLRKLVDRILGPNKLPEKEKINIHNVVEHVIRILTANKNQGITFHRDYDPSIPELYADSDQLVQAILNIAKNAVQSINDKGNITFRTRVKRKVTIGEQRYDLVVDIAIIDDGPGIPVEMHDKVFFPLVTGRAEGTGLGLTIAQSLVLLHDGLIEFTSVPGQTRFSVLLPISKEGK
jgi:two-component system nitrogen regulation sensor histidine kinase GlnL